MSAQFRPQNTPALAPKVYLEKIQDGDGVPLAVPQHMRLDDVMETDLADKIDLVAIMGSGQYANGLVSGKSELSFSLTVGSLSAGVLSALWTGADVQGKRRREGVRRYTVPSALSMSWKIRNLITVHFGWWDSTVSVKIGAATLAAVNHTPTQSGTYRVVDGIHWFARGDVGKTAVIEFLSNGTRIRQTIKITSKLSHNVRGFADARPSFRNDAAALARVAFSNSAVPAAGQFMCTAGGVAYFNPGISIANGKTGVMTHHADGQVVQSSITAFPPAGFDVHVDVFGGADFEADNGVTVNGDALSKIATGTPATGQYLATASGYYTFAAADAGDTAVISYDADYYSVAVNPPNDGVFEKCLGVYKVGGADFGEALTRVARTWPLAIGNDQYVVDGAGNFNFDGSNQGDSFDIVYLYEEEAGAMMEVVNKRQGQSAAFRLTVVYELDGDYLTIELPYCKAKGGGIPMKQGAASPMKFEVLVAVDRRNPKQLAWSVSM